MKRRTTIGFALLLGTALLTLAGLSRDAWAWWGRGHQLVTEAATARLPEDVPTLLRVNASTVAWYSADPDLWKHRTKSLRSREQPEHYLDLELLKGRELPDDRKEFLKLCGELKVSPAKVGMLPYAIVEYHDRLALAFAELRRWPDEVAVQAKVLYLAGVLSHYTADSSQPLHCTIHFDGRIGADGKSPRSGVHELMDALPERLGLEAKQVPGATVQVPDDLWPAIVEQIKTSHKQVDRVYEFEARLPQNVGQGRTASDEVRQLGIDTARRGADFTAQVWASAWRRSADIELPDWHQPPPAIKPVSDQRNAVWAVGLMAGAAVIVLLMRMRRR